MNGTTDATPLVCSVCWQDAGPFGIPCEHIETSLAEAEQRGHAQAIAGAIGLAKTYVDWCTNWDQINNEQIAETVSEEIAQAITDLTPEAAEAQVVRRWLEDRWRYYDEQYHDKALNDLQRESAICVRTTISDLLADLPTPAQEASDEADTD